VRILRALVRAGAGWTVLPNYLCLEDLAAGRLAMIDPPVTAPRNSFHLVWARSTLRHRRVALAHQELLRLKSGRDRCCRLFSHGGGRLANSDAQP